MKYVCWWICLRGDSSINKSYFEYYDMKHDGTAEMRNPKSQKDAIDSLETTITPPRMHKIRVQAGDNHLSRPSVV